MGGIVASEASRKNFDVPNNIIKRLHEKKIGEQFVGAMAPLDPPGSAVGLTYVTYVVRHTYVGVIS